MVKYDIEYYARPQKKEKNPTHIDDEKERETRKISGTCLLGRL